MKSAAARFSALSAVRNTALHNAREASRLTIPGLIPSEGQNEHFIAEQPYQSVGADGVRSLSARLLMILFPTSIPFFRCEIDASAAEALGGDKAAVDTKLAQYVQSSTSLFEETGARKVMAEVLRHLIIAGNVLLYIPLEGSPRLFRIDQYVVKRDHVGAFREIIVKEKIYPSTLSADVRSFLGIDLDPNKIEEPVEVFTIVERQDGKVVHWQEIKGKRVPNSEGQSPADSTGWMPLRWLAIPGSDYGRSHVTEYLGDIMSLEDANSSIIKMAAAASRILYLVDPNSGIDVQEVVRASSGDVFDGSADSITSVSLNKTGDFSVVSTIAENIERRVNRAFLVRDFRQGDRVTAEEIRSQSEELESTLGGTYSTLADELQLPVANRYLYIANRKQIIPAMPEGIKRKVVTGLAALGQAAEVNRLRTFVGDAAALGIPVTEFLNIPTFLRTLALQHGVSGIDQLLKSEEQRAEEQQQAMMAQVAQQAAPGIATAAVQAATTPE